MEELANHLANPTDDDWAFANDIIKHADTAADEVKARLDLMGGSVVDLSQT